nr:front-end fatty acid desaturase group A [Platynereis dumerilii]
MGKGGQQIAEPQEVKDYTWTEVKKHQARNDKWLVIDGEVYDITNWARKHPGGSKVISHYAGQDATEAFRAFHNDLNFVKKYMKAIHIGRLNEEDREPKDLQTDFEEIRQAAHKMGLFKPSVFFFLMVVGHILMFEAFAYMILSYFGTGWLPYLASLSCYIIVQAQAGWTQHDFGHLSVFKSSTLNHLMHLFLMNQTKGASSDWWNHMHYQHHAKPNVMNKDPDVRLDAVFVVGKEMPKVVAQQKNSFMPYNHQHKYFMFTLPPLLFPLYFQVMLFRHVIIRKLWVDLVWTLSFYVKFFFLYTPLLGFFGAFKYYFVMRTIESVWFVWVTQSNHIPMEIQFDQAKPWFPLQLSATCDIYKSYFNDWFTGHLNFQVEHHLFPTMPRHNLFRITPLVKSMCEKHNIPYIVKPLSTAFIDIVRSLKTSGELWLHYREAYHMDSH